MPKIGDVARVRDCEIYFHLPEGLPHGTEVLVVGFESGRYVVQALGREWNIPMQCLVHEEERWLNGQWLDQWDRRLRKAQVAIDRMHAQTMEEDESVELRQAAPKPRWMQRRGPDLYCKVSWISGS